MHKSLKTLASLCAIAPAMTILVACSSEDDPNPDMVNYNLDISFTEAQLGQRSAEENEIKQLVRDLSAKRAVSFNKITDLMEKKHARASSHLVDVNGDSSTLKAFLDQVTPDNQTQMDNGRQVKISYEESILEHHDGVPMIYNLAKANVVDVMVENRMQCYSGTYIYQLIRRRMGAPDFRKANEVVIFEPGHVKAGYVLESEDGLSRALIGIETTQTGGGGSLITVLNESNRSIGNRIVLDAELFALMDLIQNDIINPNALKTDIMQYTADKYGFDLEPVTSPDLGVGGNVVAGSDMINSSIFAFGEVLEEAGDQERHPSGDDGSEDSLLTQEAIFAPAEQEFDASMELNRGDLLILTPTGRNSDGANLHMNLSLTRFFGEENGWCEMMDVMLPDPYSLNGFSPRTLDRLVVGDLATDSSVILQRENSDLPVLFCNSTEPLAPNLGMIQNAFLNEAIVELVRCSNESIRLEDERCSEQEIVQTVDDIIASAEIHEGDVLVFTPDGQNNNGTDLYQALLSSPHHTLDGSGEGWCQLHASSRGQVANGSIGRLVAVQSPRLSSFYFRNERTDETVLHCARFMQGGVSGPLNLQALRSIFQDQANVDLIQCSSRTVRAADPRCQSGSSDETVPF